MVSNKNMKAPRKRPYTQKARAQRRDAVHRRITLAAVELHGSLGPARTTVSEVAKRAGVRRATVYNHFPTDFELIDACSSHWFSENLPPDSAPWAEIPDPEHRIATALIAMYGYYDRGQSMLENVLRDAALVPALEKILQQKWWPMMEGIVEMLAAETGGDKAGDTVETPQKGATQRRASLKVALDFFTWRTLSASGLSNENAARLATAWVSASGTLPL
jgi:AcrR family transcriptional regulator